MSKTSIEKLQSQINNAATAVPTGLYRHYKGEKYEVVGYGINEETQEVEIEYVQVNSGVRFHRSLTSWMSSPETFQGIKHNRRFTPIHYTPSADVPINKEHW